MTSESKYQGKGRVTACLHQCMKVRVQPAQVSAFPLMRFLLIPLREKAADKTPPCCRAVAFLTVVPPPTPVTLQRWLSGTYQNIQAPSRCTLITPEQFIAAIINGHESDLETSLRSSLKSCHAVNEQRE